MNLSFFLVPVSRAMCESVCVCVRSLQLCLFATLWTVACQAPLSMGFSRQEYWSGLPGSPPGDLPDPEIEPESPMSPALAGRFFTNLPPGKPRYNKYRIVFAVQWFGVSHV